ncbi:flagellar biosynthetic protein FliO [Methylocapsa acidiphila]|uniref:flagellar biosynthetic protein FliO n=1 Tax=Methylocapsa acidiphila TaxID=133552 RepID=UPI0004177F39|nr:flagellar biosynthetic protein FliO [Methylocapsa acidiphila]
MQALNDLLASKSLMFVASALAVFIAAILLYFLFRLAFGRRLRLPGNGRGRLPRLGVVDAFDLDRQRQLVIVRRDNVEHLIMIGGPNDLVIESQIIRAEAREPRIRDKEPREAMQAPPSAAWPPELDAALRQPPLPPSAPTPMPSSAPMPAGPGPLRKPPVSSAPAAVEPQSATSMAEASSSLTSPPRSPVFPLPPRRPAPAFAPRQPPAPLGRLDQAQREKAEGGASAQSIFPRAPLATPFLRSAPPRSEPEGGAAKLSPTKVADMTVAGSPAAGSEPEVAEIDPPETAPSQTIAAPLVASSAPDAANADPLDSIEEEMAKLLGRSPAN